MLLECAHTMCTRCQ